MRTIQNNIFLFSLLFNFGLPNLGFSKEPLDLKKSNLTEDEISLCQSNKISEIGAYWDELEQKNIDEYRWITSLYLKVEKNILPTIETRREEVIKKIKSFIKDSHQIFEGVKFVADEESQILVEGLGDAKELPIYINYDQSTNALMAIKSLENWIAYLRDLDFIYSNLEDDFVYFMLRLPKIAERERFKGNSELGRSIMESLSSKGSFLQTGLEELDLNFLLDVLEQNLSEYIDSKSKLNRELWLAIDDLEYSHRMEAEELIQVFFKNQKTPNYFKKLEKELRESVKHQVLDTFLRQEFLFLEKLGIDYVDVFFNSFNESIEKMRIVKSMCYELASISSPTNP